MEQDYYTNGDKSYDILVHPDSYGVSLEEDLIVGDTYNEDDSNIILLTNGKVVFIKIHVFN